MQVGELFIALGFDVDDAKLKSFNDGIKSSMTDLLKLSGIAAGAVFSVNKFIESSLHNSAALRQFTAETGESAEALKKWQVAAQLANPEMGIDEVTAAFKRMNAAISEAQYSGAKGGVFAQLNIENVQQKSSAEILDELRRNFQMNVGRWGLPKTLDFMEQLGVPKSMARTFQMSDEDIDRMTRGLTVTQEQNEAITDLADSLRRVSLEWQHFKDVVTAEYSDELITFIDNASAATNSFYDNMKSFVDHAPEFSGGLKLMAASFGIIVAALFPLTSALVGIVALFNDVGSYARGAPSMIGDIVDAYHGKKQKLEKPKDLVDVVINDWKEYLGLGTYEKSGMMPRVNSSVSGSNVGAVTMSNTYNISSLADPKDVAKEVDFYQQLERNRAYSQLNRGGF